MERRHGRAVVGPDRPEPDRGAVPQPLVDSSPDGVPGVGGRGRPRSVGHHPDARPCRTAAAARRRGGSTSAAVPAGGARGSGRTAAGRRHPRTGSRRPAAPGARRRPGPPRPRRRRPAARRCTARSDRAPSASSSPTTSSRLAAVVASSRPAIRIRDGHRRRPRPRVPGPRRPASRRARPAPPSPTGAAGPVPPPPPPVATVPACSTSMDPPPLACQRLATPDRGRRDSPRGPDRHPHDRRRRVRVPQGRKSRIRGRDHPVRSRPGAGGHGPTGRSALPGPPGSRHPGRRRRPGARPREEDP